jgi:hypothetical protein
VSVNTIGPLDGVKGTAIFLEQRPALLDALARDQDVQIIPEGFCELRLVVEQDP